MKTLIQINARGVGCSARASSGRLRARGKGVRRFRRRRTRQNKSLSTTVLGAQAVGAGFEDGKDALVAALDMRFQAVRAILDALSQNEIPAALGQEIQWAETKETIEEFGIGALMAWEIFAVAIGEIGVVVLHDRRPSLCGLKIKIE
jgi:hypothetical protein